MKRSEEFSGFFLQCIRSNLLVYAAAFDINMVDKMTALGFDFGLKYYAVCFITGVTLPVSGGAELRIAYG